ncbi:MAG: bifunctional folylpolyglutamate synthase/dihydrofolate synthase [Chloroflexota bacterium]
MTPQPLTNETDAITYVFRSLAASDWQRRGLDEDTRDLTPTRRLLNLLDLPGQRREYAVVTGSKGKGSVTAITARLLRALGHRTGMVTSPHLTTYRQRFRIDGAMISEADLVRLINQLRPAIDRVQAELGPGQYLSPQGIFLALALTWFDEQDVTAAVIEVGRGGRYDDNSLVPNMLSLFTPIILEHTRYLGSTVARIAWHKAGIIKPHSYAYSLPQSADVMDVIRTEAESKDAVFEWLAPRDMGQMVEPLPDGQRVDFGRYGVVDLPLLGHYEIDNASLAIWAAGNMHGRLGSTIKHGEANYVQRIRAGLESVLWPGRCQQMQTAPRVYVDGSINPHSAARYLDSVRDRLTPPVVGVLAVPADRDLAGVCAVLAPACDTLILTATARNVAISFRAPDDALAIARRYHHDVRYAPTVAEAHAQATARAGEAGSVLMALAQPAIGDLMAVYGEDYAQI